MKHAVGFRLLPGKGATASDTSFFQYLRRPFDRTNPQPSGSKYFKDNSIAKLENGSDMLYLLPRGQLSLYSGALVKCCQKFLCRSGGTKRGSMKTALLYAEGKYMYWTEGDVPGIVMCNRICRVRQCQVRHRRWNSIPT